MTNPKYCKNCVWAKPDKRSEWALLCHNPKVNAKDYWALSHSQMEGTSCSEERQLGFFSFPACGKSGKLHEEF